jgi:hypothetical protein
VSRRGSLSPVDTERLFGAGAVNPRSLRKLGGGCYG